MKNPLFAPSSGLPPVRLDLLAHWRLKLFAIPLIMGAFFAGYFVLLKNPIFPVFTMPLTPIDSLIGFQPATLPVYLSLWLYVQVVPLLLSDRRELIYFGFACGALSLAGFAFFFLWPTTIPRAEIDWTQHPGFEFLKTLDAAGNACPSLHVAFAVFTAVWLDRVLQRMAPGSAWRLANWLWCAGIAYSTLATKQHVLLDAVAGAGLGWSASALRPRTIGALARTRYQPAELSTTGSR
jgi:hypothetical protein